MEWRAPAMEMVAPVCEASFTSFESCDSALGNELDTETICDTWMSVMRLAAVARGGEVTGFECEQHPLRRRMPSNELNWLPFIDPAAYGASGTIRDFRIVVSRVTSGTPCSTLVAAMISSAGSPRKSSF